MAEDTTIGWCHHTFNPWMGCTKVAAGCTNCYAEAFTKRTGKTKWGPSGTRVLTSDANWKLPVKWNRDAEREGVRRKVFCASLADVFEEWDGPILDHHGKQVYDGDQDIVGIDMGDVRRRLFRLIDATPYLDWPLLTKRPENILSMWPGKANGKTLRYRHNVWLLTSVATQEDVDRNVPLLLECRILAPVIGLSCEPLLEPIDLKLPYRDAGGHCSRCGCEWGPPEETLEHDCPPGFGPRIDWIIVGGESGPKRRSVAVEAIESVAEQCERAAVPCYVKQDCGPRPGMQGRISDRVWAIKQFPRVGT